MQEVQTGNLKAYDRELSDYHWLAWPEYGNNKPFEWPAIYWDPQRLRPLDSGGFWLSDTPEEHSPSWDTDCIRACQWIRFRDLTSGGEFVHANTHLDHRSERARYESITDDEALEAFQVLCHTEGIIPALEPAHALAHVIKLAPEMACDQILVMNLCGRGDKDVFTVGKILGFEL